MRHELVGILPRLNSFACRLTGSRDDGADLVQSACQRALESVHQWRPDARLDSWMYRIIHNLWIDGLRKQNGRRTWPLESLQDAGPSIDGRTTVDARMMLRQARKVIKALPREQRDVLQMIVVDGQSYKDTAHQLGVPVGTVMSRLARARGKIKSEIGWPVSALLIAVALGLKTEDEALADDRTGRPQADLSFAQIAELERAERDAQMRGAQANDQGYAKTIVALAYVLGWLQEQRGLVESDHPAEAQNLDGLVAYLVGDEVQEPAIDGAPIVRHGEGADDKLTLTVADRGDGAKAAEAQGDLPALESLAASGPEESDNRQTDGTIADASADTDRPAASGGEQAQPVVASLGGEVLEKHMEDVLSGEAGESSLVRANATPGGFAAADGPAFASTAATFQLQSTNSQIGLTATAGSALLFAGTELLGGGQILIGTSGDDILTGGDGDDVIYGGGGDDVIDGGIGSDEIHGGIGDDVIRGGDAVGPVVGVPGSDRTEIIATLTESQLPDGGSDDGSSDVGVSEPPADTSTVTDAPTAAEAGSSEPEETADTSKSTGEHGESAIQDSDAVQLPPVDDPAPRASVEPEIGDPLPPDAPAGEDGSEDDVPEDQAAAETPSTDQNDVEGGNSDEPLAGGEQDPVVSDAADSEPEDVEDSPVPPQQAAAEPVEDSAPEDDPDIGSTGDDGDGEIISDPTDDDSGTWWGYDDFLFGGRGDDQIWGGKGNDWLFGGQGSDRLHGGDDDDLIFGGDQADRIWGGEGDDILVGGNGHDRAYFDGDRSDYLVSGSDETLVTVTDLRDGSPTGWDFLIEVETLEFNDGSYAARDLVQQYQAWISGQLVAADADDGDPIPLGDVVDGGGDDVELDSADSAQPVGGAVGMTGAPPASGDPLPPIDQVVEDTGSAVQVM